MISWEQKMQRKSENSSLCLIESVHGLLNVL